MHGKRNWTIPRELYIAVATELNKIRQDLDAALETKLAAFQQAAEALQLVADEECSLRKFVSSIRLELEEVKRKQQTEMKDKEAETEFVAEEQNELNGTNEHNLKLQQISSEIENATSEAEEMKKNTEELKIAAEAVEIAAKEVKQKLELALEQAEEAKAAEKKALDEMQVLSGKRGIGNLDGI